MRPTNRILTLLTLLALSTATCQALMPQRAAPKAEGSQPASPLQVTDTPIGRQRQPETQAPPSEATQPASESAATSRRARLAEVTHWFYYLDFDPEDDLYERLAASDYDMVVIEPIVTEEWNTDFPITEKVARLHNAPHPKLVLAYVDIGQAEDWRTYWQEGWEIGDPDWIVAEDPDGWEGNYPVAYWREEWRQIWLAEEGYLQLLLDAGFDGIYLDWVEAFSDQNVIGAAREDRVDPLEEIKRWVADLASFARARQPDFLVIAQNAAELLEHDDYLETIDAIAQEQIWFDGGADNDPPGDCPLPRAEEQVESREYVESLSPDCLRQYEDYLDSTLHVSSEWYLGYLTIAHRKGVIIFTVDYALDPENIAWVYQTSRSLGFIPFVSERGLSIYINPVP